MERPCERTAADGERAAGNLAVDQRGRHGNHARIGDSGGEDGKEADHEAVQEKCLFGEASGDEAAEGRSKQECSKEEEVQRIGQIRLLEEGGCAQPGHNQLHQQFQRKINQPTEGHCGPGDRRETGAVQNDIPQAIKNTISDTSMARTQSG